MTRKNYRIRGSKDNIIISLAGAHGVGKTTIFHLLKKQVKDNPKFKFFPERYKKNPPFPFGSKDKQIAFRSEFHFLQQLAKRNKNIKNFEENYNGRIIILDRTPLCVLIYSKSLFLKEKDFNLIKDMYDSVSWRDDYVLYLTAEPETILKRTIQRGSLEKIRKEWNETEMDYLKNILSFYQKMLVSKKQKKKIFVLDTEKLEPQVVLDKLKKIITEISGYSFKKCLEPPSWQMNISRFLK
ncbi:MAG: deoxynucleoside kinase [Candidatus Lokiarchaeota archaeon]|nr:deoxynucleoside kinase [Candidatus Lokiarchaeota archaeon]